MTYARANSTGDNAAKVVVIGLAPCRTDAMTMSLRPNVEIGGLLIRLSIDVIICMMIICNAIDYVFIWKV